jgi:hypothetical protein
MRICTFEFLVVGVREGLMTSPLARLREERGGLLPQASRCALVPGLYVTSRILRSDLAEAINAAAWVKCGTSGTM